MELYFSVFFFDGYIYIFFFMVFVIHIILWYERICVPILCDAKINTPEHRGKHHGCRAPGTTNWIKEKCMTFSNSAALLIQDTCTTKLPFRIILYLKAVLSSVCMVIVSDTNITITSNKNGKQSRKNINKRNSIRSDALEEWAFPNQHAL